MTSFRLRPFCTWAREGGAMIVTTPENEWKLRVIPGFDEDLFVRLQAGWVQETPLVRKLADLDAVTAEESPELQVLWRLDEYFRKTNVPVNMILQGTRHPEYELGRDCYCVRTGSAVEGYGQASTRELAMLKAAVEVYERLGCYKDCNDELIVSDQVLQSIDWRRLYSYEEWQYDVPGFEKGRTPRGSWVGVCDISTAEWFRVPEEVVFFDAPARPAITVANSSGVACHTSYEEALLRSVYELIERDALMVRWFRGQQCDQIAAPLELHERLGRMEELGYSCIFLNLTLELAPVVLAILRGSTDAFPRLALGMASHSSPLEAMAKALEEVELRITFAGLETTRLESPTEVRTTNDHQLWYDQPENHAAVLSLVADRRVSVGVIPEGPSSVGAVADRLAQLGSPWFTVELNERGYAMTGVHTIRSIVPGLTSIGFGHTMEPLGVERLHHPMPSMGWGDSYSPRTTRQGYVVQPFA
jgi:thiazole/oxazole-forming peptide maturase SagD family component